MATVRAQRLLNNVVNGTTNSTALQTALGDASTRGDWQELIAERGKARLIAATTNSANATGGSALATEDYISSVLGPQEMLRNATRFNASSIGATVAASNSLLNTWTSNTTLLTVSQRNILGRDIYVTPSATAYGSRIFSATSNGAASWDVWMPALDILPSFGSTGTDMAMNNDGSILLYLSCGNTGSTTSLLRSTDKGGTFGSAYVVNASFSATVRAMDFGAGVFVVVGDSGNIWSSTDGITWTQRTSGHTNAIQRVSFANGVFLAAGPSNIMRSTDGITWTNLATGPGTQCYSVRFVGSDTWLVGYASSTYLRSTNNGGSFSSATMVAGYTAVGSFAENGSGFVLAGVNGGALVFSTNRGSSWTNLGALTGMSGITTVVFYGGRFIIRSDGLQVFLSVNDAPSASSTANLVSTDSVYITRNGYNMLSGALANGIYDMMVVKQGRLFVRGNQGYMTYRGQ
jgi:hypothetical protein